MSAPEMLRWVEFYRMYPFDDDARFNRPAAIVAAAFGADSGLALRWLRREPMPDESPAVVEGFSDADLRTMAAFGMTPPKKD